jgi:glutamate/tyrosine decarboxylase-like PLP-dependent enzyme
MAVNDTERRAERFDWHPEPDLIGFADVSSRPALEALGHEAWSAALDYLYDHAFVRAMGEPAGYAELREAFFGPDRRPGKAPLAPMPSWELLEEFRRRIAPHQLNAYHPRSLSYFTPPPLTMSIVGELLAQVTQQGVDVWHAGPLATFVEEEVVRWLCDLIGYDGTSFGLLTSGGVMANFLAMALVRDVRLAAARGLTTPPRGAALEGARVYTSDQTHFSIARALDELGFPADTLVVLPTDDRFRLHPEPVAEAIARDRAAGLTPVAISAVAGSTNTGSVDLIEELAAVARDEGLWFHVDAAYGAAARLSARDAWRVPGLELADSVAVDPHKWFFQAYDIGGLVIRDGSLLQRTFGAKQPEYYRGGEAPAGAAPAADDDHDGHDVPGHLNFYKLGFEGTRRWRALKLWMSWKHVGTSGFGRLVADTIDVAQLLARRCAESDDFEALPPDPELSVVCFRHLPAGAVDGPALDDHQDALQAALEADGDGWLSTTRLRGSTWLRAGIVNPHTTPADIDRLIATLRRLAADLG